MSRRILYSRMSVAYVGIIFLIAMFVSSSSIQTSIAQKSQSESEITSFLDIENSTFTCYLSTDNITRGEDDLVIFFQFTYENLSYIPDSDIYYNISNSLEEKIYENNLIVNTSLIFNDTIIWSTFNSQAAGNFTVTAVANSTSTILVTSINYFELAVLPFGKVRMSFPSNPALLVRNQNNDVACTIANTGGTTITNVTVTSEIHKTGTSGSVTRSHAIPELTLEEGVQYHGYISFFPDTYLYQKHSFSITYRTIDEPEQERILLSDPLEIIVMPNITINEYEIPLNATVGETYRITYSVTNYEGVNLNILPYVRTQNSSYILFDDVNLEESIEVGQGYHPYSIEGEPQIAGIQFLFYRIELEWETVSETKWYSNLLPLVISYITIYPEDSSANFFNPVVTYSLIFGAIGIGIFYFSRDMFKNIAKRVRGSPERAFPEVTYLLNKVILDGSNIAWEEKNSLDKPKISNIENMINRLSKVNFNKIITVADAALRYQIDNQKRLDKLVKEGAMKMLPARVDGDKFILRLAEEENAMIVSNDMFKEFREMKTWIDQRRIPYTILENEVYLHPTAVQPIEVQEEEEISD
ncbi:MAG: NYN domain-containing protein [Candidatus Heimdallarchaeaceae archaeon]